MLTTTKTTGIIMKKIKKRIFMIITSSLFVLMMMFNISISLDETGQTDVNLIGVSALATTGDESGGDCTNFGYRTWDSPWSSSSGYDCLCEPRSSVRNSCGG